MTYTPKQIAEAQQLMHAEKDALLEELQTQRLFFLEIYAAIPTFCIEARAGRVIGYTYAAKTRTGSPCGCFYGIVKDHQDADAYDAADAVTDQMPRYTHSAIESLLMDAHALESRAHQSSGLPLSADNPLLVLLVEALEAYWNEHREEE